jgi:hypothetical protein
MTDDKEYETLSESEEENVTELLPAKKKEKKYLKDYTKALYDFSMSFEKTSENAMQSVIEFAEKFPPVKPKKTIVTKRSKAAYDYFRENQMREKYKGMSIKKSSPLISQEWHNIKNNLLERKVWDDMVVGIDGGKLKDKSKDPYGLFAEEERVSILQLQPTLSRDDVNKMCRIRWREKSERDKGVWYAKKAKICES